MIARTLSAESFNRLATSATVSADSSTVHRLAVGDWIGLRVLVSVLREPKEPARKTQFAE
jgi:hypothetical protein